MQRYLRVFASGILLCGCAHGGAFVSAGSIDYGKLIEALRCEIADARAVDRTGKFATDKWVVGADVQITGRFARELGLAAGIDDLVLHGVNKLSAGAKAGRAFEDAGKVTLGFSNTPIADIKCDPLASSNYDLSALGLGPWYQKVSSHIGTSKNNEFLEGLEYKRTVVFLFIDGKVSISLFSPGAVIPSLLVQNSETAEITVTFRPPSGPDTVLIDPESLRQLAEIIRTGRPPPKGHSKSDDVLKRIEKRENQELNDKLQKLNNLL